MAQARKKELQRKGKDERSQKKSIKNKERRYLGAKGDVDRGT